MFLAKIKKHFIGILAAITIVSYIPVVYQRITNKTVPASVSTTVTNWGLKFHEDGKTPTGNATPEFLKNYNSYFIGDESKNIIYLTFDCGYEKGFTPHILDVLQKHNAKAAFFVVGNFIQENPDLINRMISEGHIVGNHTFHHPDMSKIADMGSFQKELDSLSQLYTETTGQEMEKFYRPPQGKFSEDNLKNANALGYQTIFWSLAYVDWYEDKQPTKEEAFKKLLPRIHPGAIVLLHNTSQTNSEILDELLSKWEEMGYTFGTLEDFAEPIQSKK